MRPRGVLFALLYGGPLKLLLHTAALAGVELEVHGRVCHPRRVKVRGVLVHQMGVLGAARTAKVLHLCVQKQAL